MAEKCTIEGCKALQSTKYGLGLCIGHVRKLHPHLYKQAIIENKERKRDTDKGLKPKDKRDKILYAENFDLEVEIGLVNENSNVAVVDSGDPIDLPLQKMKLFAKWLNADDLSRHPQTREEVAELLNVSVRRLQYWSQGVTVRKMMADQLDNAMKYDARKIALTGFLELLQEHDPKAVIWYMQSYMTSKKSEKVEEEEGIEDWKADLIKDLPEDAPADRKDKLIRGTHEEAGIRLVSNE